MKKTLIGLTVAAFAAAASAPAMASADLAKKHNCAACHAADKKLVGPSYKDIAAKYKSDSGAAAKLAAKVKKGGSGVWGPVPMPPNAAVPDADIATMVGWILAGGK